MEHRGARIRTREMRGGKLFLRAEAGSPGDFDAIRDPIRRVDPDLPEIQPVLTVREGADPRQERPAAKPVGKERAGERLRQGGDRGSPAGASV